VNAAALLYRLRIRVLPRYLTAGDSRKRWQYGIVGFFGVIVFFGVLFFSLTFFRTLLASGDPELATAALSATFNLTVVILAVTGLAAALYTLYLSGDLEVLSATPVKERTIFSYKFLETMIINSPLFLLSALPISIAYGFAAAGSALPLVLFFVLLPVVSALLLALPTALCIFFSMPLMRILPASRAKEIVAGVGAILGAISYLLYLNLISPGSDGGTGSLSSGGTNPSGGMVYALRPLLESPVLTIPPGSWASGALSGSATSEWGGLLLGFVLLAGLCAAAYLLCLSVSSWAYATGRAQAAESGGQVGSSQLQGVVSGRLLAALPRPVRAVAFKELRGLRRDFRRLASVAAPVIILLGAFFVNSGGLAGGGDSWFVPVLVYLPAVAAGGILASLLAAYSVGAEGGAYWYLHASPLKAADLMAGKLAASVLYGSGASFVFSVVVAFAAGSTSAAWALFGVFAGTLGGTVAAIVCGLYGIGVSAMFANFEGENPNQVLSQAGNFVMMLLFFGLALAAGLAAALAFGLSLLIPIWLAVPVAALAWTGGCAAGGYAIAASGAESLERVDQ
jgi:hypothetical protein